MNPQTPPRNPLVIPETSPMDLEPPHGLENIILLFNPLDEIPVMYQLTKYVHGL
jgi:hypothetical protein